MFGGASCLCVLAKTFPVSTHTPDMDMRGPPTSRFSRSFQAQFVCSVEKQSKLGVGIKLRQGLQSTLDIC
jgi:hypothetical protein